MVWLYLVIVFVLFIILGKSADLLIENIKKIAERLNVKIFIIGIILGILTTMPEFFLGINSIKNNLSSISLGNLFGGVIILFSLLFGVNLFLNKNIPTSGNIKIILPNLLFIFFAFLIGLKGDFNIYNGITFIFLYFIIIFYVNKENDINIDEFKIREKESFILSIKRKLHIFKNKDFIKEIIFSLFGILLLLVTSNFIVHYSQIILDIIKIPKFFTGLIMFSIGTNLPELMVIFKSIRNGSNDLSVSHLIGSAMANVFILSLLSFFNKFIINVNASYILTLSFLFVLILFIIIFYKTGKSFSRKEGIFLIFIYILFISLQILIL